MRLNVRVNVFNEIGTMKDVTLEICDNNTVEWISKMEMKRINIKLEISGAYNDDKLIMDICAGAILAKCKKSTNEIQSQKHKWILGTLPNSGRIDTTNSMIQLYYNLIEYGTQKKYLIETDQIMALTTLMHEMQGTIKINNIALATNAKEQATEHHTKKNCRPLKVPYTVEAWQLVKKEDTVTVDEMTWYW